MAYDHQEQEQLDALRAWFQTWGKPIAAGIVVAAIAFGGWTGWNYWTAKQSMAASGIYDELTQAAQAGKTDDAKRLAGMLTSDYSRTAYAAMGALLAGKTEAVAKDYKGAQAHFEWVIEHGKLDEFVAMARLRLAAVQADQNDYDGALKTLASGIPASFEALAADRRGDIYQAQGRKDDARKAFAEALEKLPLKRDTQNLRQIIEIKRDALGEA